MDIFHPIDGFDGYFINKNGEILSKKHKKEGRLMNPGLENKGYYRVFLTNNYKERKTMKVHRLLALTFIPNPDNLLCIDHIDKCRKNNSLSNLRWATHTTNNQNRTRPKNNKLGHKNINLWVDKRNDNEWYRFSIVRNGKAHTKSFKTLAEAIKYRNEYLIGIGEEIIN